MYGKNQGLPISIPSSVMTGILSLIIPHGYLKRITDWIRNNPINQGLITSAARK